MLTKCDEIKWGAKFVPAYETHSSGDVLLYFDKIHEYSKVDLKA